MTGTAQRETPQVAIFWLVQATEGEARLLAAGCPLDQAEPYGNCLTNSNTNRDGTPRCGYCTRGMLL